MCEEVHQERLGRFVLALKYVCNGLDETSDEDKDVNQMKADFVCPQTILKPFQ